MAIRWQSDRNQIAIGAQSAARACEVASREAASFSIFSLSFLSVLPCLALAASMTASQRAMFATHWLA
jgi:hypothetical protein